MLFVCSAWAVSASPGFPGRMHKLPLKSNAPHAHALIAALHRCCRGHVVLQPPAPAGPGCKTGHIGALSPLALHSAPHTRPRAPPAKPTNAARPTAGPSAPASCCLVHRPAPQQAHHTALSQAASLGQHCHYHTPHKNRNPPLSSRGVIPRRPVRPAQPPARRARRAGTSTGAPQPPGRRLSGAAQPPHPAGRTAGAEGGAGGCIHDDLRSEGVPRHSTVV